MAHTAIAVFTHENLATLLRQRGSQGWRIDMKRAREREFLVCVQNREHPEFHAPGAPHRAAFLVGHIAEIVPSSTDPKDGFIIISEYTELEIQDSWDQRNPVKYTTLEALGIDPNQPFRPLPSTAGSGFSEMTAPPAVAFSPRSGSSLPGRSSARARFDAILAQIDRIPDLPTPFDPHAWDEHGLPQ